MNIRTRRYWIWKSPSMKRKTTANTHLPSISFFTCSPSWLRMKGTMSNICRVSVSLYAPSSRSSLKYCSFERGTPTHKNAFITHTRYTHSLPGNVSPSQWVSTSCCFIATAVSASVASFHSSHFLPSLCLDDFMWFKTILRFIPTHSQQGLQKSFTAETVNFSCGNSLTFCVGWTDLGSQ